MANEGIKQRIVGAIVLVCAGIILWSVLFTGPVNPALDTRTQIPPPPAMETFTVPEPRQPQQVESVDRPAIASAPLEPESGSDDQAEDTPTPQAEPVDAAKPASPSETSGTAGTDSATSESPPAGTATTSDNTGATAAATSEADGGESHLDEKGLPIAWVVQVASFTEAENAEQLKQTLQKAGYKAFTEKVTTGQGTSTRVRIGPKLSKARAQAIKAEVDKAHGLDTMILRFAPSNPQQPTRQP